MYLTASLPQLGVQPTLPAAFINSPSVGRLRAAQGAPLVAARQQAIGGSPLLITQPTQRARLSGCRSHGVSMSFSSLSESKGGADSVPKRRVVVTGLGAVSPLGNSVKQTWDNVLAGKSGIDYLPEGLADAKDVKTQFAGLIKDDFDPTLYIAKKELSRIDPFIQYGISAAEQAIEDAGLSDEEGKSKVDLGRIGVIIGSGIGGIETIAKQHDTMRAKGPGRVSPFFIPGAIVNMVSGHVSMRHGFTGPSYAISTACATGTHSIASAARLIQSGDADAVVAGGTERAATPLSMAGFNSAQALSTRNDDPKTASRPWDEGRDGFVIADGAAVMVLEDYDHAVARGAPIYAELKGAGFSSDAHHITAPPKEGTGAAKAMSEALRDSGLAASAIDYVNAHGTSTPLGDVAETRAIKSVFGAHADKLAVSSTKSSTGHMIGAAGAIEALFSVLAIRDKVAPPTINLQKAGEGCDLDYVPNEARSMSIDNAMSNSFGFGGTNGALIFGRVED